MKKIKRILAALLLCVMAVSLAGCAELDEMKAHHAFWGEDGVVEYNGYIYRALTPTSMLGVWDAKDTIYVTDKDVPVLLSEDFGTSMTVGRSGILLESNGYSSWGYNEYFGGIYCREDYYESVMQQIQNGPDLSLLFYNYWNDDGIELFNHLTAEEIAAVEALLASVPAQSGIQRYALNEDFSFNLERSSADYLFRDTLCEVVVNGKQISLVNDVDSDGLVDVHPVPAEQQVLFEKMIEKLSSMYWVEDKMNIEEGDLHYSI